MVGTLVLAGLSTSLIHAQYDVPNDVENVTGAIYDVPSTSDVETFEPLPLSLQNQVTDQIITENGHYAKIEDFSEEDFSEGEVVNNYRLTTPETKVIINEGYAYIKIKDGY